MDCRLSNVPALYEAVAEGDEISIDLAEGVVSHSGNSYSFPQIPPSVAKILRLGGLANYLQSTRSAEGAGRGP